MIQKRIIAIGLLILVIGFVVYSYLDTSTGYAGRANIKVILACGFACKTYANNACDVPVVGPDPRCFKSYYDPCFNICTSTK